MYKRTRKDHVLNQEPVKLKQAYCEMCFTVFSQLLFKLPHNCKRCFRTICENCGQQREKIVGCLYEPDKNHRICNICKEERVSLQYFVKKNNLKWGNSSKVSERWLQSFGYTGLKGELKDEFEETKEKLMKVWTEFQSRTPEYEAMQKDLKNLEGLSIKSNYSLCEFFELVQEGVASKTIQSAISNVLLRFMFRRPEIGYTKEYSRVVSFLLCFCSQPEALFIFENLIYYLIPPPLFPRQSLASKMSSVEQYIRYLVDELIDLRKFENKDILLIKQYLSGNYYSYYSSIFVNYLSAIVTYTIFDALITKKEFRVIEKYTKSLCFKFHQQMRLLGSNTDVLNEVILRSTIKISDLDSIASKYMLNTPKKIGLELLDKDTYNRLQAKLQSPPPPPIAPKVVEVIVESPQKAIEAENLQKQLEIMNECMKALQDELASKSLEIESLTKESAESQRKSDEANKSLKTEVFNLSMLNMKISKKHEDQQSMLREQIALTEEKLKQQIKQSKESSDEADQRYRMTLKQLASERQKNESLVSQNFNSISQNQNPNLPVNSHNSSKSMTDVHSTTSISLTPTRSKNIFQTTTTTTEISSKNSPAPPGISDDQAAAAADLVAKLQVQIEKQKVKISELTASTEQQKADQITIEKKHQKELENKQQRMQELETSLAEWKQKAALATQESQKLLSESLNDQKDSMQLYEQQLNQKQLTIDQKSLRIAELEESLALQTEAASNLKVKIQQSNHNDISQQSELRETFKRESEKSQGELALAHERIRTLEEQQKAFEDEKVGFVVQLDQYEERFQKLKTAELELRKSEMEFQSRQSLFSESLQQKEDEQGRINSENQAQIAVIQSENLKAKNSIIMRESQLEKDNESLRIREAELLEKERFLNVRAAAITAESSRVANERDQLLEQLKGIGRSELRDSSKDSHTDSQAELRNSTMFLERLEQQMVQIHNQMNEDAKSLCREIGIDSASTDECYPNLVSMTDQTNAL